MKVIERQEEIVALLKEQKQISIQEICEQLHYSESTVRRDLKQLEHAQIITCARGGAVLNPNSSVETPLVLRKSLNRLVKISIAREAARLVQDNQIIILDASTTVQEMIPYLKSKKNLTVITSSLPCAQRAAQELNCTLICLGGKYHKPTASFLGGSAIAALNNWFADQLFFSCAAIDAVNGLTNQGDDFAQMEASMLHQSKKAVLLADSTKFGKTAAYRLPVDDIDKIIVDYHPMFDEDIWKSYRKKMLFVQEPYADEEKAEETNN
jgi:DeoR/GlpR family transcriptional regulator of sugar metabolism